VSGNHIRLRKFINSCNTTRVMYSLLEFSEIMHFLYTKTYKVVCRFQSNVLTPVSENSKTLPIIKKSFFVCFVYYEIGSLVNFVDCIHPRIRSLSHRQRDGSQKAIKLETNIFGNDIIFTRCVINF